MNRRQQVKRRVGKYEVGRTIGEGTFAKVKFARNSETGEPVALKILDKEKVLKHKMAEQIRREIATMKLIKHPNVVQLYEVMASKTKIFIILEYVTGGELFDKIVNDGRMKEDEARRYFQQLIHAVDYCHSRGVYHRDLKPENLLLDSYGNLKISDFGLSALSQQVRDDGLLHTSCGTPNYVAPEVLNDRGYDGATADMWSCGVVLYVLLAGYLPFDDSNLMNLYKKISSGEFNCPPWLSLGAMKLITRILDPNPMTRVTPQEVFEDEWFKKDYKPPVFEERDDSNMDDIDAVFKDSEEHLVTEKREEQPAAINAFEIISMSRGLNLENLFDPEQEFKRETRITLRGGANEIIEKIEEAAKPLTESEASGETSEEKTVKSVLTVKVEPESKVVQQDIVDMYMKSMQQFTDSLAKMKLPLDIDSPTKSENSSSDSQKLPTPKSNNGSRVFYGSRPFF